MRATESFSHTFAAAGVFGPLLVTGGRYLLQAHSASWGGGSLDVQVLGPDGSTYVSVSPLYGASHLTADGAIYYDLPPGTYQFDLATTTAANVNLARVPLE